MTEGQYSLARGFVLTVIIFLIPVFGANAQQRPPSIDFNQFREDIRKAETPRQKLDKYLELSIRARNIHPDSLFVYAHQVENIDGLTEQEAEAYKQFIQANAWRRIDRDSAIYYASKASDNLRQLKDSRYYFIAENMLGLEYVKNEEFLKAESVFTNAISFSESVENTSYPMHSFYGNLGNLYSRVGAHDLAVEMFEKFLEVNDNPADRCNILSRLAENLAELNKLEQARELLQPCLEYTHLPPPIQAIVHSNLSEITRRAGNEDRSLDLMEKAAEISYSNKIPNLQVTHLVRLGEKYLEYGETSKADSIQNLLARSMLERNIPEIQIHYGLFLADLYLAKEDYEKVIRSTDETIALAERTGRTFMLRNVYQIRAAAFEALNKLNKAIENLEKQGRLEEDQQNRQEQKDLAMMQVRYQLQNKESELLEISDKLSTVKIRTAVIILLVLIFGSYILYRYRIYYLLREEKTRNRIARDLHDDLSATLSSISFFSEAAKRVRAKEGEVTGKYLSMIDSSAVEAKEKINDIIWAIDPENDDWEAFLKKCKRFASDTLDSRDIEYDIEVGETLNLPSQPDLRHNLWLIFKEMISNLVRHSEASKALISMKEEKGAVVLIVKDDGKGFNRDSPGKGHGIKNIRHRAAQIEASLTLDTALGKGTAWKLELDN